MLLYFFSLHVYIYFTSFVIGPFTFPPRPPPLCEARDKMDFFCLRLHNLTRGTTLPPTITTPPPPRITPHYRQGFASLVYRACHLWCLHIGPSCSYQLSLHMYTFFIPAAVPLHCTGVAFVALVDTPPPPFPCSLHGTYIPHAL